MPYKVWAVGEEVLAADFQTYLQDQVVPTFASAAARDAEITGPSAGQIAWLADVKQHTFYSSGWRAIPGTVVGTSASTGATNATTSTYVALAGSSFTFTAAGTRVLKVELFANVTTDTAGKQARVVARSGGTAICSFQQVLSAAGGASTTYASSVALASFATGSHTIDMAVMAPQAGTITAAAGCRVILTETGLTSLTLLRGALDDAPGAELLPGDGTEPETGPT